MILIPKPGRAMQLTVASPCASWPDRIGVQMSDGTAAPDAVYRDPARPTEVRIEDLLSRMTLPEKAGMLFHDMVVVGDGGRLSEGDPAFGLPPTERAIG